MTDRELIVAAAEKVMRWNVQGDARSCAIAEDLGGGAYRWRGNIWPPSDPHIEKIEGWNPLESIADAWMLVEAMRAKDWLITVKSMPAMRSFILEGSRSEYDAPCPDRLVGQGKCSCEAHFMGEPWQHDAWEIADTAPRAIVMACLRAVGVDA